MIVADTNLISYLHFKSQYSDEASKVHELDPIWVCPILWRSEFLNVVSLHIRKQLISFADGLNAIDLSRKIIGEREFTVSPVDTLELSVDSSCSTYDCEFVALARDFGIKLVTYDKKVLTAFPKIVISASEFIKINKV